MNKLIMTKTGLVCLMISIFILKSRNEVTNYQMITFFVVAVGVKSFVMFYSDWLKKN